MSKVGTLVLVSSSATLAALGVLLATRPAKATIRVGCSPNNPAPVKQVQGAMADRIRTVGERLKKIWPDVTGETNPMPPAALEIALAQAYLESGVGRWWKDKGPDSEWARSAKGEAFRKALPNAGPQGSMVGSENLGARQCGVGDTGGSYYRCVPYGDSMPQADGSQKPIEASFRYYTGGKVKTKNGEVDMTPGEAAAYDFLHDIAVRFGGLKALKDGSVLDYVLALGPPLKALSEKNPKVFGRPYQGGSYYYGGFGATAEQRVGGYGVAIVSHLPEVAGALGHDRIYSCIAPELFEYRGQKKNVPGYHPTSGSEMDGCPKPPIIDLLGIDDRVEKAIVRRGNQRAYGFWRGCGESNALPDPKTLVDPHWSDTQREILADYLDGGKEVASYRGTSRCRICGAPNGNKTLTDGVYAYPNGLSHYVRQHSVAVPADMLERAGAVRVPHDVLTRGLIEDDLDWYTDLDGTSTVELARSLAGVEISAEQSKALDALAKELHQKYAPPTSNEPHLEGAVTDFLTKTNAWRLFLIVLLGGWAVTEVTQGISRIVRGEPKIAINFAEEDKDKVRDTMAKVTGKSTPANPEVVDKMMPAAVPAPAPVKKVAGELEGVVSITLGVLTAALIGAGIAQHIAEQEAKRLEKTLLRRGIHVVRSGQSLKDGKDVQFNDSDVKSAFVDFEEDTQVLPLPLRAVAREAPRIVQRHFSDKGFKLQKVVPPVSGMEGVTGLEAGIIAVVAATIGAIVGEVTKAALLVTPEERAKDIVGALRSMDLDFIEPNRPVREGYTRITADDPRLLQALSFLGNTRDAVIRRLANVGLGFQAKTSQKVTISGGSSDFFEKVARAGITQEDIHREIELMSDEPENPADEILGEAHHKLPGNPRPNRRSIIWYMGDDDNGDVEELDDALGEAELEEDFDLEGPGKIAAIVAVIAVGLVAAGAALVGTAGGKAKQAIGALRAKGIEPLKAGEKRKKGWAEVPLTDPKLLESLAFLGNKRDDVLRQLASEGVTFQRRVRIRLPKSMTDKARKPAAGKRTAEQTRPATAPALEEDRLPTGKPAIVSELTTQLQKEFEFREAEKKKAAVTTDLPGTHRTEDNRLWYGPSPVKASLKVATDVPAVAPAPASSPPALDEDRGSVASLKKKLSDAEREQLRQSYKKERPDLSDTEIEKLVNEAAQAIEQDGAAVEGEQDVTPETAAASDAYARAQAMEGIGTTVAAGLAAGAAVAAAALYVKDKVDAALPTAEPPATSVTTPAPVTPSVPAKVAPTKVGPPPQKPAAPAKPVEEEVSSDKATGIARGKAAQIAEIDKQIKQRHEALRHLDSASDEAIRTRAEVDSLWAKRTAVQYGTPFTANGIDLSGALQAMHLCGALPRARRLPGSEEIVWYMPEVGKIDLNDPGSRVLDVFAPGSGLAKQVTAEVIKEERRKQDEARAKKRAAKRAARLRAYAEAYDQLHTRLSELSAEQPPNTEAIEETKAAIAEVEASVASLSGTEEGDEDDTSELGAAKPKAPPQDALDKGIATTETALSLLTNLTKTTRDAKRLIETQMSQEELQCREVVREWLDDHKILAFIARFTGKKGGPELDDIAAQPKVEGLNTVASDFKDWYVDTLFDMRQLQGTPADAAVSAEEDRAVIAKLGLSQEQENAIYTATSRTAATALDLYLPGAGQSAQTAADAISTLITGRKMAPQAAPPPQKAASAKKKAADPCRNVKGELKEEKSKVAVVKEWASKHWLLAKLTRPDLSRIEGYKP